MAQPDLNQKLNALRQIYLDQLPERTQEIERIWMNLPSVDNKAGNFETLRNLIHRMSGSAGTYGFPDLSNAAKTLEYQLEDIDIKELTEYSSPTHKQISSAIGEIIDLSKHYLLEYQDKSANSQEETEKAVHELSKDEILDPSLILYLVDESTSHPNEKEWKTLFESYGYRFKTVDFSKDLQINIDNSQPAACLYDISSKESLAKHAKDLKEIFRKNENLPLIILSDADNLETRLMAARCGSQAFLLKPIDVSDIIDHLDKITMVEAPDPYKVFIVDDDYEQAAFSQTILEDMGMKTKIVTDPMMVLEPLFEFQPDIILMDLYMPGCTGFELATVIRQLDSFVGIPIVYLSSETRHEKQFEAMKLGGDEFLTKPVDPKHLVEVVSLRVERLRSLRSFMVRDSLTGLLNHSSIQDALQTLLSQAKRNNEPLSFVLIDIDHFKNINDTYGHLTGDRVLKRLSRFLKKRLRKGDVVGRYGGEEFAIVLPNTTPDDAYEVIDSMREKFSQIDHPQGEDNQSFQVTLSAGIATYSMKNKTSVDLTQSADEGLYTAKAGGRNMVVVSE